MVATDEAVDWVGGLDALIEQIAPTDYCAGDDPTVHNIDLCTTGCFCWTHAEAFQAACTPALRQVNR